MESFHDLAFQRQSDRSFDPEKTVDRAIVCRILESAWMAPSACNAQPWHFIVVDDPELKNKVADATSSKVLGFNHFTKQAAVHILIVEEKVNLTSGIGGWVKNKSFAPIDIGIAALGWFDENKMRELLSIPSNKRVVLDIVLGYSTQADRPKKRKPWNEVVSFNTYRSKGNP